MKMTSRKSNLDNLVDAGLLKVHIAKPDELKTHIQSAEDRLKDASIANISKTGKFSSLYDASHSLCIAATKMYGYRPGDDKGHRQGLFSIIDQVVPAASNTQPILIIAHRTRNLMEYDGNLPDMQDSQLEAMQSAAANLMEEVIFIYKKWLKENFESK